MLKSEILATRNCKRVTAVCGLPDAKGLYYYQKSCHFYADDTQPYCSFTLHDQAASVQAVESCLNDIDAWMLANMLKLNRDKTELLVIGPKHKVNPPIKGIHVAGAYTEVSNNARNIRVNLRSGPI